MRFDFNRKEYESKNISPGGYVGKIVNVTVKDEVVSVYFDINMGELKDTFMKSYKSIGGTSTFDPSKWNKKGVVNYNFQYDGAKYAFARLLDDLEASNQTFKWNNETNDLKNKLIGVVYKKNIYEDKYGVEREGTDFPEFTSLKNIADQKFSIEPKSQKKSEVKASTQDFNITDDDLAF